LSTSALISLILLILIRVKSFSLAVAFLIQPSTSVVLSGSGGTIFNGSDLAAAVKKRNYLQRFDFYTFIIPFQPPAWAGVPLPVTAA
jgi:preprotein translocase subunit SecG